MKITIFGAGAFGTALGTILEGNGHQITYYDPVKYPDRSLTSVIEDGEIYLLAVPSVAAPKLLLFTPRNRPLICASKGFISDASFKPWGNNFSVLSGGAFANDLNKKNPVVLTATSDLITELFKTDWLAFDRTTDASGVMLCGALKNIYAIGAGYWSLNYATPDFDDFINSVLSEMKLILSYNNCDPKTVDLSCGLRDLVITCGSHTSRNYDFGTKLKLDKTLGEKVLSGAIKLGTIEGLSAISTIDQTPTFKRPENVPIFDRIIALVKNQSIVVQNPNITL